MFNLWNLLKLILWFKIWSFWMFPLHLELIYIVWLLYSILQMSIRSNWVIVLCRASISLLLFFVYFCNQLMRRSVKISSYDCGFVYFFLLFCHFGFINVEIVTKLIHFRNCCILFINCPFMKWPSVSLTTRSVLKSTLSVDFYINIATPGFLYLLFTSFISSHPLNFHLVFVFLYLNCFSHIDSV